MIKYIKPAIITILLIISSQLLKCQSAGSVSDNLAVKLKSYCLNYSREEVYIHSDRDEYIAGEDIWFNAYVFDRYYGTPSELSGLLYFEVLNKDSKPVIQKRIRIEGGAGPGQVLLPDTLSTGPYIIRAYTNLMKNYLPGNAYTKVIRVYNALKAKGSTDDYYTAISFDDYPESSAGIDGARLIEVSGTGNEAREITVSCGSDYITTNGNSFTLLIETRGKINFTFSGNIQSGSIRATVSAGTLPAGINHITLFNSSGKAVSEKYIYTPGENSAPLTAENLSEVYGKREKVAFSLISSGSKESSGNQGNVSISVVPSTNNNQVAGLEEYTIFGSEFGMVPWQFLKGRKIVDLSPSELDTLLFSLKSEWIDWERIVTGNFQVLSYQAEKEEHYLPGKLLLRDTQESDSGKYILMSAPGKVAGFQYARTGKGGNFSMKLLISDRLNDLVIQPDLVTGGPKIKIESSFSDKYLPVKMSEANGKDEFPLYLKQWGANFQVRKIYGASYYGDPVKKNAEKFIEKRFYGKPDVNLLLDDYIKLPVMEEIFFELVPGVFMKKRKAVYEITMSDPVDNKTYENPPGMFIDGVPVKDANFIGTLDPESVERIEVVKEKYFVGNFMFFGILNVITRSADFSSLVLPEYATRISYRVVDPVWTFISPEYSRPEKKMNRIPDFRNTLWWNPCYKTGENGSQTVEFWTSDIPGTYIITIEGTNSAGNPVSYHKSFRVE
jgi:hypothetical protein